MNSVTTYSATTTDSDATKALGAKLARLLKGGEAIELSSDLGGGKTTFVQGVAAALGYAEPVTSPTFTLSNIYRLADGREIHHYDLYRLNEGGIVGDELAEDLADDNVITLVEWGGVVAGVLPEDRLRIDIEVTGDDERQFTFVSGGPVSERLVKELSA